MITVPISRLRARLADLGNRVALRGERVMVERRGRHLFALVPAADMETLERMENERDIRLARRAMKSKGAAVPWKKVRKELGI